MHRKCGITYPGISVIPIASISNRFRKAESSRSYNRAISTRKKQFKCECRSVYDLLPAACISGLRDPALPVVCIVAYKDGEGPIEFGPDVELVSYDDSWTLKTLREGTGGPSILHFVFNICSSALNVILVHVCGACICRWRAFV